MNKNRYLFLSLALPVLILALCPPAAGQSSTIRLPPLIAVSTYDVGSSTFTQAGAIGDALMKKIGTKIRVVPSGTDISRTLTLKNKTVDFCLAGVGTYYFAEEGLYEFATPDWGPQRIQAVWNCFPVGGSSLMTAKDAGIKTPYDLKGKRLWWVIGAPAHNVTNTAFLAFTNLTWDDAKKVVFPSWGAAIRGLIEGSVDGGFGTGTSPQNYELENSRRGIWWPTFSHSDKEGWKRLQAIAPYMVPARNFGAPGHPPEGVEAMTYSFPLTVAYEWKDDEVVYQFVKAIDEYFPLYKDSFPALANWERKKAIVAGFSLPFHRGAVRYFKEIGLWNQEFETWQRSKLEKQNRLAAAWSVFMEEAAKKSLKGEEFSNLWQKRHDEAVKEK